MATVVLLVSLPRLRDFALRENQGDARGLVSRLGRMLENEVEAAEPGTVRDLVERNHDLSRQLEDVEYLDGGRLLRRHGYLFELLPADTRRAQITVRAWPWEHGRSGLACYIWVPERGLAGHPNGDGRWSGRDPAPAPVFTPRDPHGAADWHLVAN